MKKNVLRQRNQRYQPEGYTAPRPRLLYQVLEYPPNLRLLAAKPG